MCKKYKYKGMVIYENDKGSPFNTTYFTVVNPYKKDRNGKLLHAHACSKSSAQKIVDCFWKYKNGSAGHYSLSIRNKAMRLNGEYVIMKY